MGNKLRLRFNISYPGFALDVDLELPGRGITALFGHSGSGKTTCLRAVAGLERAADGYLEVNGEVWQDGGKGTFVPTHRRALGYVFQEASLFSHLSVRDNLNYGLKRSAAKAQGVRFEQAVEWLDIAALLGRRPEHLSGGERQRVAIARALLSKPRLLLFDEPLAALDLKRKAEILPYLERLHDTLDIPMLYVSHSPDEVARLADHLVLLAEGKAVASGPLQETLARIDLPAVFADDAGVVIDAVIGGHDDNDHLSRLDFAGGTIYVSRQAKPLGRNVRCRIHARDVSLNLEHMDNSSILNIIRANVVAVADTDNPANVLVRLDAAGTPLLARITRRSLQHLAIRPGVGLWAQIKAVALLG
ncbi:MAG: molybdenum ABC transporter ATP-binding protein [Methylovulum sp.]|nr:molybdenum ABC transporter ATP-binding protein [Methylovulum sp.]